MKKCRAVLLPDELPFDMAVKAGVFSGLEKHAIDNLLWSDSGYQPEVSFQIAYTHTSILLKYSVHEEYSAAVYRQINDPVYKDSCVEFFIAFNNEDAYYNLEFNSLGTPLAGYGSGKNNRVNLHEALISRIGVHSTITNTSPGQNSAAGWELALHIPFDVFSHHQIHSLKGQAGKVNFYKCGDDLPHPHFLSWSNIIHPSPNFHLPEFFGSVQFI